MDYSDVQPCPALQPYIHSFWQLQGGKDDRQWERIFPDGCPGIVINLGEDCTTDNGNTIIAHGKTYVVGAMTSFKESFITSETNLLGVCVKPGIFPSLYNYASQKELTDLTVELEHRLSFDTARIIKESDGYLNSFFFERAMEIDHVLQGIVNDIAIFKGRLSIREIASRNNITVRQLERMFSLKVGLTPKEYSSVIRFQYTMAQIEAERDKSLAEIAFECGYYDHAHLTNEIKKLSGRTPMEL